MLILKEKQCMKKFIIFVGLFVFLSFSLFAQTWTIRTNLGNGTGEADIVFTVISKQQYDRLLNQHTAQGEYGRVQFTDKLELQGSESSGRVIKGAIPKVNGYYYRLAKVIPLSEEGERLLNLAGIGTSLIYGNSNTGQLTIQFGNYMLAFGPRAYLLGSDDFNRVYNQCIGFVNGE
jgi:hypothetical protein